MAGMGALLAAAAAGGCADTPQAERGAGAITSDCLSRPDEVTGQIDVWG